MNSEQADPDAAHNADRRDPLEALADEFARDLRRGRRPSIEDYAVHHPDLADRIRALFPTLMRLERAAPAPARRLERLGEYRIVAQLGHGGMGIVFEAVQETLGRRVALKTLPMQASLDARFVERFRREARAVGHLQHAHIVPVFDVGESDGLHYYAMQFVDGLGLDALVAQLRVLKRGEGEVDGLVIELISRDCVRVARSSTSDSQPLSTGMAATKQRFDVANRTLDNRAYQRNVAAIGAQIADALAHAHASGILHRDVKPSNILLDRDGDAWLADFGLCKPEGSEDLTLTGDVVGTIRYMPPERFSGRSDARGDVYGLGLVLYELLTLKTAFESISRTEMLAGASEHLVTPRKLDPSIPVDLETIVCKSIEAQPEDRYATADALAQDLRAFLDGRPIVARAPSVAYLLRLAVRRNKLVAATIAAALLTLIVGTAVYVRNLDRARKDAVAAQRAESSARKAESAAREDQTRQLYAAKVAAADSALRLGDVAGARKLLDDAPNELRHWEWRYLHSQLDTSVWTSPRAASSYFKLVFAPDGRQFGATIGNQLEVWDAHTHTKLLSFQVNGDSVNCIAVSRDGNLFATGERTGVDADINVFDSRAETLVANFRGQIGQVQGLAIGPDNDWLVSLDEFGGLRRWDLRTKQLLAATNVGIGPVTTLALARDGSLVAIGAFSGDVALVDPARMVPVTHWRAHDAIVNAVEFTPDGSQLLSASSDKSVRIWSTRTQAFERSLLGHLEPVTSLAISPDGQRAATGSEDKTVRVWSLSDGRQFAVLGGHTSALVDIKFSPDGRTLVSAATDATLKQWLAPVTGDGDLLLVNSHGVYGIAFDARGSRMVTNSGDTTACVWDFATRQQECVLLGHLDGIRRAAISRDGARIATVGWDGAVNLWEGERLTRRELASGPGGTWGAAFSPNGEVLATCGNDNRVTLWSMPKGERLAALVGHTSEVNEVAFSPDGAVIASCSSDGSVRLWSSATHELVATLDRQAGAVLAIAFSPDGSLLAAGGIDPFVALWNVCTRDVGARFDTNAVKGVSNRVEDLCFFPDGSRLVVTAEGLGVQLWDTQSLQIVATLPVPHSTESIGVSPDGHTLVAGTSHGEVRLWSDDLDDAKRGAIQQAELDRATVERQVVSWLHAGLTSEEVEAKARYESGWNDAQRGAALHVARTWGGRWDELVHWTRTVVDDSTRDPRDYARAEGLARTLWWKRREMLGRESLWGAALYRAASYPPFEHEVLNLFVNAKHHLENAIALDRLRPEGTSPIDLAFLSMTCAQLGELDEAGLRLANLEAKLASSTDALSLRLLDEARSVVRSEHRSTSGATGTVREH